MRLLPPASVPSRNSRYKTSLATRSLLPFLFRAADDLMKFPKTLLARLSP